MIFAKLTNDPAVFDDLWPQTLRLLGVAADTTDASGPRRRASARPRRT
jgi:hypothetical protein